VSESTYNSVKDSIFLGRDDLVKKPPLPFPFFYRQQVSGTEFAVFTLLSQEKKSVQPVSSGIRASTQQKMGKAFTEALSWTSEPQAFPSTPTPLLPADINFSSAQKRCCPLCLFTLHAFPRGMPLETHTVKSVVN